MTKFLPSYGLSQITVKLGVLQREVLSWIAFGFFFCDREVLFSSMYPFSPIFLLFLAFVSSFFPNF